MVTEKLIKRRNRLEVINKINEIINKCDCELSITNKCSNCVELRELGEKLNSFTTNSEEVYEFHKSEEQIKMLLTVPEYVNMKNNNMTDDEVAATLKVGAHHMKRWKKTNKKELGKHTIKRSRKTKKGILQ